MVTQDDGSCESTAVIICGGGPAGALLSALLGQMRVPNVVLEREAEITTDPRGIGLDEDGIRLIQGIGMYERIYTRIGDCWKMAFISGTGNDLQKPPFLTIDLTTSDGPTGHVAFIYHKQPELERAIRDAMAATHFSELRSGCTVTSINEDEDRVTVGYTDATGATKRIRGSFLVGADGKTGYVRKKYLEPRGVKLERCEGTNYDETWVALNWHLTLPTPATHPDFPLWELGYSPEDVYDLFFPKQFNFICNPQRPAVCGRFGRPEDLLWRFEFVVHPGEDPTTMAMRGGTEKIILPYLTHPGSRYGLAQQVTWPSNCIETLRSRPFRFEAQSCNKWSQNRVILIGDAAHVFPPFAGQGIASGFRDASGLAWRLAQFYYEPQSDHRRVLEGWYTERKQQFERSLATTIRNGERLTNGNPTKAFLRDWGLWAIQLNPSWRRSLEKVPRADGILRYMHRPGLPFVSDLFGGLNLSQVYAMDLGSKKVTFTDDMIFSPSKRGLLQLLILVNESDEVRPALSEIVGISELSDNLVLEDEATILIQDADATFSTIPTSTGKIARIASADEFAADEILCRNRPVPKYYDPNRLRNELGSRAKFVLVRPDRFVYASCESQNELHRVLKMLPEALHVKEVRSRLEPTLHCKM